MALENLNRKHEVEGSSDKVFGLVFAGFFIVIAVFPILNGDTFRWWAFCFAIIFFAIALIKPMLLTGLNQLWIKLGLLLGQIVSPIALGLLFYIIITPIGLIVRINGKDSLRLKFEPNIESYWIPRESTESFPHSMKNQF